MVYVPGPGSSVVADVRRSSHQSDVRVIRAGAAVGAAGHADGESLICQPQPLQLELELVEKLGQGPLGFGHGQAAGR